MERRSVKCLSRSGNLLGTTFNVVAMEIRRILACHENNNIRSYQKAKMFKKIDNHLNVTILHHQERLDSQIQKT